MAHLHRNEHLKLGAAFCNMLAAAFLTIGIITPVSQKLLQDPKATFDPNQWSGSDLFLVCLFVALIIHLVGQALLISLKEDE
jgi:hypothetical protein